jgi:hypothetical protein
VNRVVSTSLNPTATVHISPTATGLWEMKNFSSESRNTFALHATLGLRCAARCTTETRHKQRVQKNTSPRTRPKTRKAGRKTTTTDNSDDEDAHDVEQIDVDEHPDEEADIAWAEDGEAAPIGGKMTVGQKLHRTTGAVLDPGKTWTVTVTWTRVEGVGEDARKEEEEAVDSPTFQLKSVNADDDTTELDLLLLMLPLTIDELFVVVKHRAAEANDKCNDHWCKEHAIARLLVLFGASQFKTGTNHWGKEKAGLLPPPDFGQHATHDRFLRA